MSQTSRAFSVSISFLVSGGFSLSLLGFMPLTYAAEPSAEFSDQLILDPSAISDQVSPCDDFYQFSCGNWLKNTEIPTEKTGVYRAGSAIDDQTDVFFEHLLAAYAGLKPQSGPLSPHYQTAQFPEKATYSKQLGALYQSCLQADTQHDRVLSKLNGKLKESKQIKSPADLSVLIAKLNQSGNGAFFSIYTGAGLHDSTHVAVSLSQGGVSLPDKEYYLSKDQHFVSIRRAYFAHLKAVFKLLGQTSKNASRSAKTILAIETGLATASYDLEDAFDPQKIDHPFNFSKLEKLAPNFDWKSYFKQLELPQSLQFNVDEPEFFTALSESLGKLSAKELRIYLAWNLVSSEMPYLGPKFKAQYQHFWQVTLKGQKKEQSKWKQCTKLVEGQFGYALIEPFVGTIEGAAIKEKTNQYIDLITQTFKQELAQLSWLDDATRNIATEKLTLLDRKVGAPTTFRNYDAIRFTSEDTLIDQLNQLASFEHRRLFSQIGNPVDKTEWGMMPWEVNAYYDPANNEFVFPFGILQPPSFDLKANDGANLGAFGGGTIGHELTHGYDKDGSQMDPHGNLTNWWTASVKTQFDERTQCYIDQANQYEITQVKMNVDGKQTVTENVADQGGVRLGYLALDAILKTRPESSPWLAKYSERQQYWIAYAQSWCAKFTDAKLSDQMTSDPHPPSEFRVNGVVMNQPEFATDFSCKPGSRMAPANRCSLW